MAANPMLKTHEVGGRPITPPPQFRSALHEPVKPGEEPGNSCRREERLTSGFAAKRQEPALPESGSQASLGGRGSKRLPRTLEVPAAVLPGEEEKFPIWIDERAVGCVVRWQPIAGDAEIRRQSE
jgi:hypothetical protein